MNEVTLLREAGPEGPALTSAVRSAARAALLDEIGGSRTPRRRPARRRIALRAGAGLVAVAAAWTTAALVTAPGDGGGPAAPPPGRVDADGVTLVDVEMPLAPLALPVPPVGLTGPLFGAAGDGSASMSYTAADGSADRVLVNVAGAPAALAEGAPDGSVVEATAAVGGVPARVVVMNPDLDDARTVYLEWERRPGQWVLVVGSGRFADADVLAGLGAQLVDSPQAIPVQVRLAPAGFSFDFLKAGGRVIRLADDSDPAMMRGLTVSVLLPHEVVPVEQAPAVIAYGRGPVREVTVQGQPAQLVDLDSGRGYTGWYLQARFPDGTAFTVEVDGDLTPEQVVQIAEQVTYTP